jgi:hypothetical protein
MSDVVVVVVRVVVVVVVRVVVVVVVVVVVRVVVVVDHVRSMVVMVVVGSSGERCDSMVIRVCMLNLKWYIVDGVQIVLSITTDYALESTQANVKL